MAISANLFAFILIFTYVVVPGSSSPSHWFESRYLWSAGSNKRLLQQHAESPSVSPLQLVLQRYLDNEELEAHLKDFTKRCSVISGLTTFGTSANGAPLWALEISGDPGMDRGKPEIKLVGNMHGDETTGRVFTLALAEWLCENYETDPTAERIVRGTRLWLVPTMNPDGFAAHSRNNAGNVDLNRNFPDRFESMKSSGSEQPETLAMMKWSLQRHFVASLAFHEGALVANYPWDGTNDRKTRYDASPDDDTFKYLASEYANSHRKMSLPSNKEFPNVGITNGAAWYPIYGSMQDWNYVVAKCMELTIESSEKKWPKESELTDLWEDNKPAILNFVLKAAFSGFRGRVMIESNSLRKDKGVELQPLSADIIVDDSPFAVSTNDFGMFYRPLSPGNHIVIVRSKGLPEARANITIPTDGSGVVRDFVLRSGPQIMDHNSSLFSIRKVLLDKQDSSIHQNGIFFAFVGSTLLYGLWRSHKHLRRQQRSTSRARS